MNRIMKQGLFVALMCLTNFGIAQKQRLDERVLQDFKRVGEVVAGVDGKSVIYGVRSINFAENKGRNTVYLQNTVGSSEPVVLLDSTLNANSLYYAPKSKLLCFLSAKEGSMQLWIKNLESGAAYRLSNIDGGINGYRLSADETRLVYWQDVQIDKTVKDLYPDLPKLSDEVRIIDNLNYRHWDTWEDGAYSHLFLTDFNPRVVGAGRDLMPMERFDCPNMPDGGAEEITWSPDGRYIVYACKKLHGTAYSISTNTDLYSYDTQTGKTETLTRENKGYDTQPAFSPDGKSLAWLSMKAEGYESDKNRLMVMNWETRETIEATADLDQSTNSFSWGTTAENLYFIPTIEGTKQIYVAQAGKKWSVAPITKGDHDYNGVIPLTKGMIMGCKSTHFLPTELFTIDAKSGKETQLSFVNQKLLSKLEMPTEQKRWITATDGKKILTWVILPPNFDATKQYPTLLYCQGGPQSPVSQFFSYRWNFALMASKGYVVVAPNRRGLQGFGQEWNDAIAGDYAGQCMKDYLSAIDEISKEKYVNKNALGAIGASFGGYSVYWLAGNHQKRFKTFIAHCGMYNMESWYGTTEEMWFANHDTKGAYWKNKIAYDIASPHRFAQHWDTPILVIHNEKDFRVPLGQGMEAFNAAQLQGIPSRFLYFPDENHWVSKPQNSVLWQRVFFDWLDKSLKK